MELEPLRQWICDECGSVINGAQDGWLEWLLDHNEKAHGFRIVHHITASPNEQEREDGRKMGCYGYAKDERSSPLNSYVGADGLTRLLAFIHHRYMASDFDGTLARSLPEFNELTRRLQTPNYEEARLYWDRAEEEGLFFGSNEYWPYTQETLLGVIDRYRNEGESEVRA